MSMATGKELLYSDEAYTGEVDPSVFSLDYYRNKVREFQDSLNRAAAIAEAFGAIPPEALDPSDYDLVVDWLNDYWARREWILSAAEGVNLLAQGANAVGVRFPVVSVPSGLGFALPPALAIAGVAAFAAVVSVIAWAADKITEAGLIASQLKIIETIPADQRAAALANVQSVQTAVAQQSLSAQIANTVKWIAIGVGAFMVVKMLADRGR